MVLTFIIGSLVVVVITAVAFQAARYDIKRRRHAIGIKALESSINSNKN